MNEDAFFSSFTENTFLGVVTHFSPDVFESDLTPLPLGVSTLATVPTFLGVVIGEVQQEAQAEVYL